MTNPHELCHFWDIQNQKCHYEMLFLGCQPCKDCPDENDES